MKLTERLSALALWLSLFVPKAVAQVFNGPGLEGGVDIAAGINGPLKLTLRQAILILLYKVLSYLALAAVVVIVLAGFYMVLSNGSDEVKSKVKNIIIYVIIGLLIVLFARLIVGFITYGIFY